MSNHLNPGIGENDPYKKRMAVTERFLGQFRKTTIIAKDPLGNDQTFDVLAGPSLPALLNPTINQAFIPSSIKKNESAYDVILNVGQIREVFIDPDVEDAIIYHTPTSGGNSLDSDPPPTISMASGDMLYVKYLTDKHGNISEVPTIEISAEPLVSVHYQLPDPDDPSGTTSGVEGIYYVKVGKLTIAGRKISWTAYVGSDITHWHELSTATDNHPWKVAGTGTEDEYSVADDSVYGQGGPISVTGSTTLTCGGVGEIYLQVTRNVASRVLETAILGFSSVTPASDYTDQYRAIARLDGYGGILQLQKQEIRLYEVRIIANGASKFMDFDTSSRLDYDLPP